MLRQTFTQSSHWRQALSRLLACCVGLGSPSCGSWSGNPPSSKVQTGTTAPTEKQGTVDIVLQGAGATLGLLGQSLAVTDKNGKPAGRITLNSVQLAVGNITVRKDKADVSARPQLTGPFVLNLINNSITPEPGTLTLPEGAYSDISLQLYQKGGGSVQLNGTYVNVNQKSSSLKIMLDADDAITLSNELKSIQVTSGSSQQIAIIFNINQWFNFSGKDADLSQATGQDITIDASAAGESRKLRDAFLSNVKAAAEFDKLTGSAAKKDDKGNDHHNHRDGKGNGLR